MRGILFHQGKSFLPELNAYYEYFSSFGDEIHVCKNISSIYEIGQVDFVISFMGFFLRNKIPNCFKIHDYRSLSVSPFPKFKNFLKKNFNFKPNLRIFLNEYVKKEMSFSDNVPYSFIDMGIDDQFFNVKEINKKYDFVYLGEISFEREIDSFLKYFVSSNLKNFKLLLIGKFDVKIYNQFKDFKNIEFTGKVPYADVPLLLKSSKFGLNLIPKKYPYPFQTSTKLLEYCASGLNIISSDTEYAKYIQNLNKSRFFIYQTFSDLNIDDIMKFDFLTPDLQEHKWSSVLYKSNLRNLILNQINFKK